MNETPRTDADLPSEPAPPPAELAAAPVSGRERILSIDVLRGFALLGIFVMNIAGFALPFVAYGNPHWNGEATSADFGVWLGSHLFFDMKMMSIFSMLFGAGIIIFTERAERRAGASAELYYRRMVWLLLIGAAHGYLIWYGDILVNYATAGMILFFMRKKSAKTLLIAGVLLTLPAMPIAMMNGVAMNEVRSAALEAQVAEDAGEELTEEQEEAIEAWGESRLFFDPPQEEVERQIEAHHGSWLEIREEQAPGVMMFQTFYFLMWGIWRIGGMLLIGMGLYKLGVFSAARSMRFYGIGAAVGYAVGFPLVGFGVTQFIAHDFDGIAMWTQDFNYNYIGSMFVAFGHVCMIMLWCKSGAMDWLLGALAAVGRMALTNYLMQSIIATTIFYGYGFDYFASLDRTQLISVVGSVWLLQLIVSPIWLRYFRFGPAEWVWRSLTYWRMQPMRRA